MEETLLVHWATHLHHEQERRPEEHRKQPVVYLFLRVFFFFCIFILPLFLERSPNFRRRGLHTSGYVCC